MFGKARSNRPPNWRGYPPLPAAGYAVGQPPPGYAAPAYPSPGYGPAPAPPMYGPLSMAMVREMLLRRGLNYPASGNKIEFTYRADERHGQRDFVRIALHGDHNEIFSVLVSTREDFPQWAWEHLLLIVNEFNRGFRWPKAFLMAPKTPDGLIEVVCDYYVNCSGGVSVENLSDWYSAALGGADLLFTKIIVENGILPVATGPER